MVRNEFGKRQCVEALLTPCHLSPATRYVRGPKPMTDAELQFFAMVLIITVGADPGEGHGYGGRSKRSRAGGIADAP